MQQALAANPAAIITPADANALQKPIKEAVSRHIPVIGIHATAFPGPSPELGLYQKSSPIRPKSAERRPPM
jgi:ribose transport system substrate-binding protein